MGATIFFQHLIQDKNEDWKRKKNSMVHPQRSQSFHNIVHTPGCQALLLPYTAEESPSVLTMQIMPPFVVKVTSSP